VRLGGGTDVAGVSDYQCPLGAVAQGPGKSAVIGGREYGVRYGLSPEDTNLIYDAADNMPDHDPKLRQQLLEACGLS
jgi:hypothetical protein